MKPEKYQLYEGINWSHLYTRLFFVASCLTVQMPDIFDGVSAEDLVIQAFSTFFEDPDELGWSPTRGSLDRFLLGVLKHKTIDHMRRQEWMIGSFDDPDFVQGMYVVQPVADGDGNGELYGELKEAARGDSDLEQLVDAIPAIDGRNNINQQLAEELKTTPQDIVNRRKRLLRRYKRKSMIDLP
jgi:DNA-directed RNA polymerase specialized sigma24 family protein